MARRRARLRHGRRVLGDELRRASNKGTPRAFRNADRFTTFKIFRRPGAFRSLTNQPSVFSLPFWPFQLNSRIESQLR